MAVNPFKKRPGHFQDGLPAGWSVVWMRRHLIDPDIRLGVFYTRNGFGHWGNNCQCAHGNLHPYDPRERIRQVGLLAVLQPGP